jgi:hypothetical protein
VPGSRCARAHGDARRDAGAQATGCGAACAAEPWAWRRRPPQPPQPHDAGARAAHQGGFVLHQRFLEQAALVCVHGLGLGAVGPALEPGQLEVDLLDLGLAHRDLAVLALQQCVALGQRLVTLGQLLRLILHLLLQLGNQRGDLGWQVLRVDGSRTTHAKHALHRARACRCKHRHIHCQRLGWRRWRSLFRPV